MELLQLRYFTTVAKHQNITKAAMEHSIPQPAMSRTISNLEKELGVPLFDRYNNKIVLNKNGKKFYASILHALQILDDSVNELKESYGKMTGEIKLLILQSRNLIIDLITDFSKQYPDIKFTIYHNSTFPNDFEFDYCLASENFPMKNLHKTLLFTEEIMLAVEESHPLAKSKYVSIDDIREEKFISMPHTSELTNVAHSACKRCNFNPNYIIICDDPFYVRKYVSLGMGVAFAPSIAWNNLWPSNVKLLHIKEVSFTRSTYIYSKSAKSTSDVCNAFKNFLLTRINV